MSQNKTELPKKKFGLLTTIAMIAGIVIGSGVFFQTPKVIRAVEGNIWYGAAGYFVVAFGIGKQMDLVKTAQVGGREQNILALNEQPLAVQERYEVLKTELLKHTEGRIFS